MEVLAFIKVITTLSTDLSSHMLKAILCQIREIRNVFKIFLI